MSNLTSIFPDNFLICFKCINWMGLSPSAISMLPYENHFEPNGKMSQRCVPYRAGFIYGAPCSGKSRFVEAFRSFQNAIVHNIFPQTAKLATPSFELSAIVDKVPYTAKVDSLTQETIIKYPRKSNGNKNKFIDWVSNALIIADNDNIRHPITRHDREAVLALLDCFNVGQFHDISLRNNEYACDSGDYTYKPNKHVIDAIRLLWNRRADSLIVIDDFCNGAHPKLSAAIADWCIIGGKWPGQVICTVTDPIFLLSESIYDGMVNVFDSGQLKPLLKYNLGNPNPRINRFINFASGNHHIEFAGQQKFPIIK